ncbi:DUF5682 family protein [Beijerinckia sp. L45]|uniref:DUF5682 family protein n=1 Tax=Beijerinckia sp. L45 TaxID=1641855 RepID=UPI001AEE628C
MAAALQIFGIRHHGPGSARRLLEALDALRPSTVLIEGPSDASELLPMLADAAMVPPVALLTYAVDEPARAIFWPLAAYSPEYQAACWAARNGAAARFIDLPASWRLASEAPPSKAADDGAKEPDPARDDLLERDPIGVLAAAGGYQDGESWWRDVIEENSRPGPVFAAIADAMTALREAAPPVHGLEAAREAHMRLEIAKAAKDTEGAVAVVCGAWHVPALQQKASAAADRALLKGAPKQKIAATWAPWTAPRLAFASGYGAGVAAPGWCAHLWDRPRAAIVTSWLAKIAAALRDEGHLVSTASLIEAERLAVGLAALRDRPAPGFEELREAAVACLCFGEALVWDTISRRVLIGADVGYIPDDVPLAPLLEDLQREQKRLRLKPEALERDLAIDLRSESGLDRSTLLHRLVLLDVPWGRLTDAGRSRGTFRERWMLRWEPEFAVQLVENLVHGPTIAQAAAGRLRGAFLQASDLKTLADLVLAALTARLPDAVASGIGRLERRAAQTSDCAELLRALPPVVNTVRYGQARATDAAQMEFLLARILVQGALALPYAARGLDAASASAMRDVVRGADTAVTLAAIGGAERAAWHDALRAIMRDAQATPLLAGAAASLLYEAEAFPPDEATLLLGRALSPGRAVADAAGFFEGFFDGGGARLIHDQGLRNAVDRWMLGLEADVFVEHLPLFRRAFSTLDRMQRRRLLDALFGRAAVGLPGRSLAPDAATIWPRHSRASAHCCRRGWPMTEDRDRRWRLALGGEDEALSQADQRLSGALTALYGEGNADDKKRRGGLGASAPHVARWMSDIRAYFPSPVVQIVQKDAFDRLGLQRMLLEPEFLAAVEADINLVANLIALRNVMPEKTKETARHVIAKVVAALMERLERKTAEVSRVTVHLVQLGRQRQ